MRARADVKADRRKRDLEHESRLFFKSYEKATENKNQNTRGKDVCKNKKYKNGRSCIKFFYF